MADATVLPQVRPVNPAWQILQLVPGVLLLAVIGYGGKVIEKSLATYAKAHHLTVPNIEYVLWAILIGLLISNTVGVPKVFRPGSRPTNSGSRLGIVLLGSRFILGDVLKLGGVSLALVALELAVAISFMTFLGRVFQAAAQAHLLACRGIGGLRRFRHHRHRRRH